MIICGSFGYSSCVIDRSIIASSDHLVNLYKVGSILRRIGGGSDEGLRLSVESIFLCHLLVDYCGIGPFIEYLHKWQHLEGAGLSKP